MTRPFVAAVFTAGLSLSAYAQIGAQPVPGQAAGTDGIRSPSGDAEAARAAPLPGGPIPPPTGTPTDPAVSVDPLAPAAEPAVGRVPGQNVTEVDGLGAPLPTDRPGVPAAPARPLPPAASDPLAPAGGDLDYDPAVTPAPPRPVPPSQAVQRQRPEIPLVEVVNNPIRVHEARRLVLMGHWPSSLHATDVLLRRFPADARVPYLRYYLFARSGQRTLALDALGDAVALERLYPILDYDLFFEPVQGPDRFYVERVRRATAELDAADVLVDAAPQTAVPAVDRQVGPDGQPIPERLPQEGEPVPPTE